MEDQDSKKYILEGVFSQFEMSNKNPYNYEKTRFYRRYMRKIKICDILNKLK